MKNIIPVGGGYQHKSGLSSLGVRTKAMNSIAFYHYLRRTGTVASFLLFLLTALAVFPFAPKSKNLAEAIGAPVASESTIAMNVDKASANLEIAPVTTSGTFASSSASDLASFDVTTNNYTGYSLGIHATDDDGKLSNAEASETLGTDVVLDSIPNTLDVAAFSESTIYNGRWGFIPSKHNSEENTAFLPAPTTTGTTIDVTSNANNEANNYTIGLGARVDYTKPAGTYSNTFILTAVGNPISYFVDYADNSGDPSVANLPDSTFGMSTDLTIPLSSTVPTRSGYIFGGWCSLETVLQPSGNTTCPGPISLPGSAIGLDQTAAGNIATLYAVWDSTYDITIKTSTGISKVELNGVECTSTGGCKVEKLITGQRYLLIATPETGYSFDNWDAGANGYVASTTSASTTYTVGGGESIITPIASPNQYTLELVNTSATANGSTSTTATYNSSSLTSITNPVRSYTISGFSNAYNNAAGASVSSTSTQTATYTFNGWYTATSSGTLLVNTSGALMPNTIYTDGSSRWTATSAPNLYAQWTSASITLPTIAKAGHTCGWTTSTNTSSYTYTSGQSITPTASMTLYGVCKANTYTVSISNSATSTSASSLSIAYGGQATVTVTPSSGYYLSGVSCPSGYTCSGYGTGGGYTGSQTVTVRNNSYAGGGTLSLSGTRSCASTFSGYMQSYSLDNVCTNATGTLTDSRDNNSYSIRKIGNVLIMTQNLRYVDSSFGDLTSGDAYKSARLHNSGNLTNGVWYNFCAASNKSGCTAASTEGIILMDRTGVCPTGWRTPSLSDLQELGIANSLFSPVAGGVYKNKSLTQTSSGMYWFVAGYEGARSSAISWDGFTFTTVDLDRTTGAYVRCINLGVENIYYTH